MERAKKQSIITTDSRNVYLTDGEVDEPLIVPEEPTEDEDVISTGSASFEATKNVRFSSLVTTIRVAKWMARAYGYSSERKSSYVPQEVK